MAKNVEIKARVRDWKAAHATAARLAGHKPRRIQQTDVFFSCPNGRLKLRFLKHQWDELIQYHRADAADARTSEYVIHRTSDPQGLLDVLNRALGTLGEVKKSRSLYLAGQSRVHLDRVKGLGEFLELEVCLRDGQSEKDGRKIATQLMKEFGIGADDLVACAYIDLILAKRAR